MPSSSEWPSEMSGSSAPVMNIDPRTLDASAVASYVNQAKSLSITDFLLNIIPTTFVDPFAKGEILQILFLSVLFGLALCQLGERAKPLVRPLVGGGDQG